MSSSKICKWVKVTISIACNVTPLALIYWLDAWKLSPVLVLLIIFDAYALLKVFTKKED